VHQHRFLTGQLVIGDGFAHSIQRSSGTDQISAEKFFDWKVKGYR
jgi:hypothetical protein